MPPCVWRQISVQLPAIQFLMEIDKLKGVQRRTSLLGTQRGKLRQIWIFAIAADEPGALRR